MPPKRITLVCEQCGSPFTRPPSQFTNGAKRRCSAKCRADAGYDARAIEDRFWEHVDRSGDCWLWKRPTVKGYGQIYYSDYTHRRGTPAHRVAWTLATGEILPSDVTILHICDTRACVRNDDEGSYVVGGRTLPRRGHLARGTALDNNRDMFVKGRHNREPLPVEIQARGERHGNARLTVEDVLSIRHLASVGMSYSYLGQLFGVNRRTIGKIVHRLKWTHVA
jgi:hypothetical protein